MPKKNKSEPEVAEELTEAASSAAESSEDDGTQTFVLEDAEGNEISIKLRKWGPFDDAYARQLEADAIRQFRETGTFKRLREDTRLYLILLSSCRMLTSVVDENALPHDLRTVEDLMCLHADAVFAWNEWYGAMVDLNPHLSLQADAKKKFYAVKQS